jgi:hypothetical protein
LEVRSEPKIGAFWVRMERQFPVYLILKLNPMMIPEQDPAELLSDKFENIQK